MSLRDIRALQAKRLLLGHGQEVVACPLTGTRPDCAQVLTRSTIRSPAAPPQGALRPESAVDGDGGRSAWQDHIPSAWRVFHVKTIARVTCARHRREPSLAWYHDCERVPSPGQVLPSRSEPVAEAVIFRTIEDELGLQLLLRNPQTGLVHHSRQPCQSALHPYFQQFTRSCPPTRLMRPAFPDRGQ